MRKKEKVQIHRKILQKLKINKKLKSLCKVDIKLMIQIQGLQLIKNLEENNLKVFIFLLFLASKMSRFSNLVNTKKIDGDVEIEPEFSDGEK